MTYSDYPDLGLARSPEDVSGERPDVISAALRRKVLASGPCAYCGHLWPTEVDHIFPKSRGGSSLLDNLAPSCKPCNMEKLDYTPDEWRAWRESEGLPWPRKSMHDEIRDILKSILQDALPEVHRQLRESAKRLGGSEKMYGPPPPPGPDEGMCPICYRVVRRMWRNDKLYRHGGTPPCLGSGQPAVGDDL